MPVPAVAWLGRIATDLPMGRALAPFADRYLSRPFSRRVELRVQIYTTRNRIGFSQIYPFLKFAPELRHALAAEVRCADIQSLLSGAPPVVADVILLQPWFTANRAALTRALTQIRELNPESRVIIMDPCAHNDLRLARDVEPFVDLYVKKTLFRDRQLFLRPTRGDTNLTDFYGDLCGQEEPVVDWQVPAGILPKLRAGPGFFTAPRMLEGFQAAPPDFEAVRATDLHARLARDGAGWYRAMRCAALEQAEHLPGSKVTATGVSRTRFQRELRDAKIVLSPFGYGELCWRDIEGVLAGAVVLKQDMSHLETCPDHYKPWETYVPLAWDFSDMQDKVARLLADDELRHRIAEAAWQQIHHYVVEHLQGDLIELLTGERPVAPAVATGPTELAPAC